MIIYRVEHKTTKEGPYQHRWKHMKAIDNEHSRIIVNHKTAELTCAHPLLFREINWDVVTVNRAKIYSGFISLCQLFKWFGGWMSKLRKAGFIISTYSVDKEDLFQCESKTQIAFRSKYHKHQSSNEITVK